MEAVCLEPEGNLATTMSQLIQSITETATTATTATTTTAATAACMFASAHTHCQSV